MEASLLKDVKDNSVAGLLIIIGIYSNTWLMDQMKIIKKYF